MKQLTGVELMMRFRTRMIILAPFLLLMISSCEPDENNLGVDLLPPGDSISLYTDTILDFETSLVMANPVITSVNKNAIDTEREYLLGSMSDTAFGTAKADLLTQFNIFTQAEFGTEPVIDSVVLWLHAGSVEGDSAKTMQISVYESFEQLSYDSTYYHTYEPDGNYDPVPLVQEEVELIADSTYEFVIDDEDFYQKIVSAATDSVFVSDSLMKTVFQGLYITVEQVTGGGAFAGLQMAAPTSRLAFRYLPDSVGIDTAEYTDYDWYQMRFDESNAQKVNMFTHDYTGTSLEDLIDNPDANSPIGYIQGMGGVNMRVTVPGLQGLLDSLVSINQARLVFQVVPDSVSGITVEDYPERTMLVREIAEGEEQVIYDFMINSTGSSFGKLTRVIGSSAFLDPGYEYPFSLMRHFQSVITGDLENDSFLLRIYNPAQSGKFIKVWSNHSGEEQRLRLELIYSRL